MEPTKDEKVNFWEKAHKEQIIAYLSNYSLESISEYLEIDSMIKLDINVLEIGVGTGLCTNGLYSRGCNVTAMDISQRALNNVEKYTVSRLRDTESDALPNNFFDLAISHVVAQHMSNEDLEVQIKNVVRSLKEGKILAIQFASPLGDETYIQDNSFSFLRSVKVMEELIGKAGGDIVYRLREITWLSCRWNGFHVRRKHA